MENYGDFTEDINKLESDLATVRAVWVDQTALTFDVINDNMKIFVTQITSYFDNSVAGHRAVKENYNESQFEGELNRLDAKVAAV